MLLSFLVEHQECPRVTLFRRYSSGSKDHFASTPALRKEFEDALDKLSLSEIYHVATPA